MTLNVSFRRVRVFAALCLVLAAAATLTGCPAFRIYAVTVTRNVVYGVGNVSDGTQPAVYRDQNLLLDVYAPVGSTDTAKAALILVHGGGFTEGSKAHPRMVEYANFFAQRGYVCFAMDYRLRDDFPPPPPDWENMPVIAAAHAAVVDTKAAIRFVRAHAADYGIDPEKIALLGESAGAIAGVTAAVTDPGEFETDGPGFPLPESNNPGVPAAVQAYVHFWGNADHVLGEINGDDPPIFIIHGTDDDILFTPFSAAQRLHALVELWNLPHEFYAAEGFGHGAWDYHLRGKNLKTLMLEFLNEQLLGIEKTGETPTPLAT